MELITSRIALHSTRMKLSHLLLLRIDFVWCSRVGGRRKTFRMQTWRVGREDIELQRRRCRRIIIIVERVRGQFIFNTLKRSNDVHTKSLKFEASSHTIDRKAILLRKGWIKLPPNGAARDIQTAWRRSTASNKLQRVYMHRAIANNSLHNQLNSNFNNTKMTFRE